MACADHRVGALIHGRQGVGLVAGVGAQPRDSQIAERHLALHAAQSYRAVREQAACILLDAVRHLGFGVAHHVGAVDTHRYVLAAHGHLEIEPLAVRRKRTVEIAHRGERAALAGAVDGAVAQNHFITRLSVGVQQQSRLGSLLRHSLPREAEILIVARGGQRLARRDGGRRGAEGASLRLP